MFYLFHERWSCVAFGYSMGSRYNFAGDVWERRTQKIHFPSGSIIRPYFSFGESSAHKEQSHLYRTSLLWPDLYVPSLSVFVGMRYMQQHAGVSLFLTAAQIRAISDNLLCENIDNLRDSKNASKIECMHRLYNMIISNNLQEIGAERLFVFLCRRKRFPVGYSSALYYLKFCGGGKHFWTTFSFCWLGWVLLCRIGQKYIQKCLEM